MNHSTAINTRGHGKRIFSFLFLAITISGFSAFNARTAIAQYWRLSGPPVFILGQDDPSRGGIFLPGTSRSYASGEGLVTTTLNSRTLNSATFTTTHERYGTNTVTYEWDSPPEILHAGEVVPVSIRWNIGQKYKRFSPQIGSMAHLDWSGEWYTNQCYGELCANPTTSGEERNTVLKVTSNDNTQLLFSWNVHSTPGNVVVQWTYRRVEGSPPSTSPNTAGNTSIPPTPINAAAGIEGAWLINGKPTSIRRGNAGNLIFTNEGGSVSNGRFIDANTVIATDWAGGLRGSLQDGGNTIRWANGTVWVRASGVGSSRGSGQTATPQPPAAPSTTTRASNPHVVTTADGNLQPAPGYRWVSEAPDDQRVIWSPGMRHPQHPNVVAGTTEGRWEPAPGYRWVSNAPGDLRVVPRDGNEQPVASAPAPLSNCSQESIIYTNGNIAGVQNGPTQSTRLQLAAPTRITYLMSYHWNNGRGQPPGTVFLRHQDGSMYGGEASSAPGQGGVPNAYWIVRPNVVLRPGNYTVIDSHPDSWAQNAQSNGQGIVEVKGCVER